MEPYARPGRRPASAITALAAAGLILTGCSSSGGTGSAAAAQSTGSVSSATAQPGGASSGGSASTVTSSGSLPFPAAAGDTWSYRNSNGSTSENKVVSVKQVAAGQQVLMDSTFKDNGATDTSHYTYIIEPSGEISLPFSQFSSAVTANSAFGVKVISGGMYWPSAAQLATGQSYRSTLTLEYTIGDKTQRATTHVTAAGGGTQSVTVPAGTYRATVVSMLESEKFDGITLNIESKTWLAPGVGPVQSEIISMSGATQSITSKEELTSFVKS